MRRPHGTQCAPYCSRCSTAGAGNCDPGWCFGKGLTTGYLPYGLTASGICAPVRLQRTPRLSAHDCTPADCQLSVRARLGFPKHAGLPTTHAVCSQLPDLQQGRCRQVQPWVVRARLWADITQHLRPGVSAAPWFPGRAARANGHMCRAGTHQACCVLSARSVQPAATAAKIKTQGLASVTPLDAHRACSQPAAYVLRCVCCSTPAGFGRTRAHAAHGAYDASGMPCAPGAQCAANCYGCTEAGPGKCDPDWCWSGYVLTASGTCAPVRLCTHGFA